MSAFGDVADVGPLGIWDGVLARTVEGSQCSLAVVELDPGAVVAEHSHANEQLGMIVSGSVRFQVGDETRDLTAGGTWRIPANVPHEVHVGEDGAVVIDVFAPARDDWQALDRLEPRPPRWP